MAKQRKHNDGLPHNVYERVGSKTYNIWMMGFAGTPRKRCRMWTMSCDALDSIEVRATRAGGIRRSQAPVGQHSSGTFAALAAAWHKSESSVPVGSEQRRAQSTLDENLREINKLNTELGDLALGDLAKSHAYDYLEVAIKGNRAAKANKEVSLARVILEYGVRKGLLDTNPFDRVKKTVTTAEARRVKPDELALLMRVSQGLTPSMRLVALGIKVAWLCMRRSTELRELTTAQFEDIGVRWTASKRKRGTATRVGVSRWSDELRATLHEACLLRGLAPRFAALGEGFPEAMTVGDGVVFASGSGEPYTKGGWKSILGRLMDAAVAQAKADGVPFERFNLQHMRPAGVSDAIDAGRSRDETRKATMHRDGRMIDTVYDRTSVTIFDPVQ